MSITARVLLSLVILIVGAYMLVTFSSALVRATRTYNGVETFGNIEAALSFQQEVVREAERVEADISMCDITTASPPTVRFSIVMPATEYNILLGEKSEKFKYGEVWTEYPNRTNAVCFIFTSLLLVAFVVGILSGWLGRITDATTD